MTTETAPAQNTDRGGRLSRPLRRLTAVVALAATALGALGFAASPASAAASWQFHQTDTDWCYDAATIDANYNGFSEQTWFDLDNDCRWDTAVWNSYGADNFAESATYDMNEDGRWETWLHDNNQVAGFDVAFYDDNGDGYYDRFANLAASTTRSGWSSGYNTSTAGGAFSNLMVTMARFSGTVAW